VSEGCIAFERVNGRGASSHCHICGRKVTRPRSNRVVCKIHGPIHAGVNVSKNILGKKTPVMAGAERRPPPGMGSYEVGAAKRDTL